MSAKITVLDVTHAELTAAKQATGLSMAEIVRQALALWLAQRTPTGTRSPENAEFTRTMAITAADWHLSYPQDDSEAENV